MLCCTFCISNQYCSWMECHWCHERPSSSVSVAVEVTIARVSQSHRESEPLTESSVCTATDREAIAANVTPPGCTTDLPGRDVGQPRRRQQPFQMIHRPINDQLLFDRIFKDVWDVFFVIVLLSVHLQVSMSWFAHPRCRVEKCWDSIPHRCEETLFPKICSEEASSTLGVSLLPAESGITSFMGFDMKASAARKDASRLLVRLLWVQHVSRKCLGSIASPLQTAKKQTHCLDNDKDNTH